MISGSTLLDVVGVVLFVGVLYTGIRAASDVTPEARLARRQGWRLPFTAVRRHHFRSARGWRYWRWTRGFLLAWTAYVLLWAIGR